MDIQPLTLEELIDESTNINNFASNDAQAHAVSDAVNRTIGGANTVVKLIIQKLALRQEVVTLQALNVIEVCVKNCGSRFHSEIGKYKFINELIKLLSSKYDGDITPVSVKERVVSLMFSWYVGLPHEAKIGEAYKMLKQQGIIKRDPVDPNRPADKPLPREKENTAFEDEGNAQLLKTLLASKDAEDLHSANKLIKNMVKEEEERLDRMSKRIQVLETVANNVKLLDDMIGKHDPNTNAESGVEIMNELYERCLTLRPELFRLASKNVDDKAGDDSVGEILAASDELTRVIDLYKERVLFKKSADNGLEAGNQPETAESASNSTCLLDLDMSSPTATGEDNIPNTLLDEQFKLLGLVQEANKPSLPVAGYSASAAGYSASATGFPALQNNFNISTGSYQEQCVQPVQPMFGGLSSNSNMLPNNFSQPNIMPVYNAQPAVAYPPQTTVVRPVAAPPPAAAPAPKKDLFDFDVFDSEFLKPSKSVADGTSSTKVADNDSLEDQLLCLEPLTIPSNDILPPSQVGSIIQNTPPASLPPPMVAPTTSLPVAVVEPTPVVPVVIPTSTPPKPLVPETTSPAILPTPALQHAEIPAQSTPQAIPAQVSNTVSQPAPASPVNYLVPLDALKTGKHAPIPILDKDGLKTFLMLAEDTRDIANPNVIVSILSTVSLNTAAVTNFSIQVAVPKIMRVKLQPPTGSDLSAFNPFAPPPSISQVMLIANPTKENVKLRFKIMYTIDGMSHVETANIDELPVK